MRYLKLYLVTLGAFTLIDIVWLGLVANSFYRQHLGFLMAPDPNWLVAIAFYLLFIVGILVFVVTPGLQSGTLKSTLARAALFGLVTYATYDLTNQATLKDWPAIITIVDLIWGTVLTTAVSYVGFLAGRRLGW